MTAQAVAVRAVVAPERFFKNFTAQHMRAFLHQHGQQLQADRVEFQQPAFASDFQGVEVVAQVADLQGPPPAALGSAHDRFDTRRQLRQGERFNQIVIGAGLEALQTVIQLIAGREHDHRRFAASILAQALAQGVAIDAGQHDIEHDQIVVLGGRQVQARQTILSAIDGIAFEPQVIGQVGQDIAVVFNQ
ncbi:hypothetical protein D3C75_786700 [compost metagenome]